MTNDPAELRAEAALLRQRAAEALSEALGLEAEAKGIEDAAKREAAAAIPVDRTAVILSDGSPVPADGSHQDPRPDGQLKGYVVLNEEERRKGFVRPVRDAYRHVGIRPTYPTRELTGDEKTTFDGLGYLAFEPYPESERPKTGRYWTDADLSSGCGAVTTMSRPLAETYARDPSFYGSTFCSRCGAHFRVGAGGEFVWDGTEERVGT